MPEKISTLLHTADYIGTLTMYGIAIAFGGAGGFCGSSIVLLKLGGFPKWKKGIALLLGLSITGAFCSLMVLTGLLSYEVIFGTEIIDTIETVFHVSIFTGFFTSIAMMIANKGISHIKIRYGSASVDIEMNKGEK